MKERLDVLVVSRGLAPSREKAKAIIMAGNVLVDGQREDKAGSMFPDTVEITVKGHTLPYVSRGGLKLEKAMTHFGVTLEGKICMDVGASTGGFTDCMLQNGAVKVYSIDVGHGQLDWKLRNDPRVVCMERTNIRYVTPADIQEFSQFTSIDVSFISLTKVLLPVIIAYAGDISFEVKNLEFSPIKGPEGNIEYLLHIKKLPEGRYGEDAAVDVGKVVENAHKELSSR